MIDRTEIARSRIGNTVRSALLVLASAGLAAAMALALGGGLLLAIVVGLVLGAGLAVPTLPPRLALRIARARPLRRAEAPELHAILAELGRRAGLPRVPSLHLAPSERPNALTVGGSEDPVIAVSVGLLRRLRPEEVAGVLAHEVSHVANRDLEMMALAGQMARITGLLSGLGRLLLFLTLPFALVGAFPFSAVDVLVLLFGPLLAALLQLALSRTREFRADLDAARLLGDPRPLASALRKLEAASRPLWSVLLGPAPVEPGWLRTHPATTERIRRLAALAPENGMFHADACIAR